ncbi:MAG TPA: NADH-quinone oxidoreductase subunit J [Pyrinomonadaceae bacterium]|jgi:NADH-quinone oxidoreductase subunit J|nr:NADH-quinone oxidoreductase subunit J [Pyrinomonadaceae bacterium]
MLDLIPTFFFVLFGALAVGCALSMVVQRNPLYSAISLIGVFVSLACLYVTLAAPFIAAVQVIVYAGAIMVLVVFVIMLLNVEEEVQRPLRLRYLVPVAVALAFVLIAEVAFMLTSIPRQNPIPSNVGSTLSIGSGLFTEYILPFEITSVLILMAIVGAMTLARRTAILSPAARVVPGAQVLTRQTVDPRAVGDATAVETDTTDEAAQLMGLGSRARRGDGD